MHPRVQHLLKVPTIPQRTAEWYEARKTRITASEVAGILDIKPFASFAGSPRTEVLLRKAFPDDPEYRFSGNKFTEHGVKYEDEARDIYEDLTNKKVLEFGLTLHETINYLGASPDGITTDGVLIEIKCPLSRVIQPGNIPHHYWPQIQFSLEVFDLEECHFVQYLPAETAWPRQRVFDVTVAHRDREWFARVLPILTEFRSELLAGVTKPRAKAKRARTVRVPVCEIDSDEEIQA